VGFAKEVESIVSKPLWEAKISGQSAHLSAQCSSHCKVIECVGVLPSETILFSKFKYDKKKRLAQSSHVTKTKEIRLRPKTGEHDINFKVNQAIQFLNHRDKVHVSVVFRGREIAHIQEGHRVMQTVVEGLMEHGKIESEPMQQGRRIVCTIAPR